MRSLQAKLVIIEKHFADIENAKSQSIQKRTNRIADIGANLDNLFCNPASKTTKPRKPSRFYKIILEGEEEEGEENLQEEECKTGCQNENGSARKTRKEEEPLTYLRKRPKATLFSDEQNWTVISLAPRSCRARTRINYTFDEFDKTINEACGADGELDEGDEENGEKVTRGKERRQKERASRRSRKRNRLDSDEEGTKDEKNSDEASSDSEFKIKTTKRVNYYEDDDDDDDEEEDEEEQDFESDEDFRPKSETKKSTGKKSKKKKSSSSKKLSKKRKSRGANYYVDDDEDDDFDEDESSDVDNEEEDDDDGEENGEFEKRERKRKFTIVERRSTRARKCIRENYKEFEYDEEDEEEHADEQNKYYERKKSTKRIGGQASFKDGDFIDDGNWRSVGDDENEDEEKLTKKSKKYENDEDFNPYDSEEEKKVKLEKRHAIFSSKKPASRIKKIWSDEGEDDDDDESNDFDKKSKLITAVKKKSIIKVPWNEEVDEIEEANKEENEEDITNNSKEKEKLNIKDELLKAENLDLKKDQRITTIIKKNENETDENTCKSEIKENIDLDLTQSTENEDISFKNKKPEPLKNTYDSSTSSWSSSEDELDKGEEKEQEVEEKRYLEKAKNSANSAYVKKKTNNDEKNKEEKVIEAKKVKNSSPLLSSSSNFSISEQTKTNLETKKNEQLSNNDKEENEKKNEKLEKVECIGNEKKKNKLPKSIKEGKEKKEPKAKMSKSSSSSSSSSTIKTIAENETISNETKQHLKITNETTFKETNETKHNLINPNAIIVSNRLETIPNHPSQLSMNNSATTTLTTINNYNQLAQTENNQSFLNEYPHLYYYYYQQQQHQQPLLSQHPSGSAVPTPVTLPLTACLQPNSSHQFAQSFPNQMQSNETQTSYQPTSIFQPQLAASPINLQNQSYSSPATTVFMLNQTFQNGSVGLSSGSNFSPSLTNFPANHVNNFPTFYSQLHQQIPQQQNQHGTQQATTMLMQQPHHQHQLVSLAPTTVLPK